MTSAAAAETLAGDDLHWRRRAILVSVLLVGAVLSPLLRPPRDDSFPLSTYPMFARPLVGEADLDLVVGVDATGARRALSPETIAGTDEVIQAGAVVDRAIDGGRAGELCRQAAAAVGDPAVVAVLVVTDHVDVLASIDGEPPLSTLVHARCEVP